MVRRTDTFDALEMVLRSGSSSWYGEPTPAFILSYNCSSYMFIDGHGQRRRALCTIFIGLRLLIL